MLEREGDGRIAVPMSTKRLSLVNIKMMGIEPLTMAYVELPIKVVSSYRNFPMLYGDQ
jgi:hypothetical protein